MARGAIEYGRGCGKFCCSFKRITFVVCCVNLVAALIVLRSFYSSFLVSSSRFNSDAHSVDQVKKIEESITTRRAAEPMELVRAVQQLRKGVSSDENREMKLTQPMQQKLTIEILQMLQGVKNNTNMTELRGLERL